MNTPSAAPTRNILALLSLIIGIVSLPLAFCFYIGVITGIAAAILGVIGIYQIGQSGGAQTGRGLAIGGIVTGAVSVILPVCLILILALLGPAIGNVFSNTILNM
jgi:hypothetical protein